MLKTFLIESNISPNTLFDEYEDIQEFEEIEQNLFGLTIENKDGRKTVFLDTQDSRFWTLYSTAHSDFVNRVFKDMLAGERSGLDRPWIPSGEVENFRDFGEFRGVSVKYDAEKIFPEEYIDDNILFGDLSLQSSGNGTQNLYEQLKASEGVNNFLSLSNVQIRREVGGEFVKERITNEGRFTTRGGTDIQLHVDTVLNVRDKYRELLEAIEENHRIRGKNTSHGSRAKGSPLKISFNNKIENIEEFLNYMISATDPLRLWGNITELESDYYKVKGVDMHNGDMFSMEVTSDWIRLYLLEDACGNTALRIFTNLQQYYDPSAEMVIDNV